jgi:hypothetical protein
MSPLKVRVRKQRTYAPMVCFTCKKEIVLGATYKYRNGYYNFHLECDPPAHRKQLNISRKNKWYT